MTPFTRRERITLAALTLAGAALRLALAWGRPRLGDEVGTLLNLRMDAGYLLTHFSGWLTMNYFILAEKGMARLTGSEGWPLEVLPMLGGVALIPLTALLARRLGGGRLGVVAAALTAFEPYLVQFSPVLRAYAPLAALAVWSVDLFFRWRERRTWAAGSAAAAVVLLMLLMHPNGIYVVIGLGMLTGIEAGAEWRRGRAYFVGLMTFVAPLILAGAATWLAYRALAADVRTFTLKWSDTPPTSLEYLPNVVADYFGSGFLLFVPAGLLLAGTWSATQDRKALLPLCLLAGISPVLVSLKGVSHFPWAYARFQIYCVPFLLVIMAEGILWLAGQVRARTAAACALTAVAALSWVPPLRLLFEVKREKAVCIPAAEYLRGQRSADGVIVCEGLSFLTLTPLVPPGADGPVRAEDFVKTPTPGPERSAFFFVAPDYPPLGGTDHCRRFGTWQVVEYPGPATAACASLRADLARVVAGDPVAEDLRGPYLLLALLDKGQPAAREWHLLAELCRTRTARFHWLPSRKRAQWGHRAKTSHGEQETEN